MHEVSLVRSLLRQAAEIAAQQGETMIEEIRIEIGPLAGVEPLLVRSAFEQLVTETAAAGTTYAGARLVVDDVPLQMLCRACREEFLLEGFRCECPGCGSRAVQVLRGDELQLVSITVRERAAYPSLPEEAIR